MHLLVTLVFMPMFLFVDLKYNGPIKAAFHGLMSLSLTQVGKGERSREPMIIVAMSRESLIIDFLSVFFSFSPLSPGVVSPFR